MGVAVLKSIAVPTVWFLHVGFIVVYCSSALQGEIGRDLVDANMHF